MYRAVAKFLLVEQQTSMGNVTLSIKTLLSNIKIKLIWIGKPFKMSCKLFINIRINLESFIRFQNFLVSSNSKLIKSHVEVDK